MSFIISSPTIPENETPIASSAFWPEVDPTKIRENQRIDGTITAARLRDALIEAVATVNTELASWRIMREVEGSATLSDVPCETIDTISINVHRYMRAVGCYAKASLIERYRDFDTTASGNKKADQLESPIDDLRRDARWAINDIIGIIRTTIELI